MSYITEEFPPITWRVWWQHHGEKIISSKQRPEEFRDFKTKEEAEEFKRSKQASHPHSVVCIQPQYLACRKRKAKYAARQHSVAVDWPLQRKPRI